MRVAYRSWNLTNASVFFRVDANVSYEGPEHRRLRGILETLRNLCAQGAQVTVATHRGRPKGYDAVLTTAPLRAYLAAHGFSEPVVRVSENLRFDQREYTNDQEYARELANGHTHYVTDAWGTLHKKQTSIVACAELFPRERRSIGDLVAHELTLLKPLREEKFSRWAIVLGGGKILDKLAPIQRTLERMQYPPALLLGPGAQVATARELNMLYSRYRVPFIFAEGTVQVPLEVRGISRETATEWATWLAESVDAIFLSGVMGIDAEQEGYRHLLELLEQQKNPLWIGGGGTSAFYDMLFPQGRAYVSTGGGSTMAYICGDKLPGLRVIEETSAFL